VLKLNSRGPDPRPSHPRPRARQWAFNVTIAAAFLTALGGDQVLGATPAPDLNLPQYRGKVVYIDFWASWCGPCKLSFPYMQQLASRYPTSSFVLIAVNVDHERDKADQFLRQTGSTFPIVYDPNGAIASKYPVKGMPTSVLIGRDGRVRYVHSGFFPDQTSTYTSHIQELLSEK
jgi:cytochrome c biogenesis protein CcmG/thiol:disulfide interchange protein DsbE